MHQSICRVFCWSVSGISSMRPWHVSHPTPFFTWTLWLKYTKSGRSWTRSHCIGRSSRKLARTGSRIGAVDQICEWQFMQVLVGGIPANEDFSTDVWQYRQSIPMPPTWWAWLNWIGCSTNSSCLVAQDDLMRVNTSHPRNRTRLRTPNREDRASAFALRGKIWLIAGCARPKAYMDRLRCRDKGMSEAHFGRATSRN